MRGSLVRQVLCRIGLFVVLSGLCAAAAQADPITVQGYTVTDLGAGTPTFSTDANGGNSGRLPTV